MELDTLIAFGDGVKSLGDGKIAGYLVRFGNPAQTDLEGDYFTKDTDFDCEFPFKSTIYYNHGLDPQLKRRKLGKVEMKMDDVGIWVEGQIEERDEYEKAIAEMARQNKLGWSSGTASHLVERKKVGNAKEITMWPLGLDASVTPTPAEFRNAVVSIKSYMQEKPEVKYFDEDSDKYMTINALAYLNDMLWYNAIYNIVCDAEMTAQQKAKKVGEAFKQCAALVQKAILALLTDADEETVKAISEEIRANWQDVKSLSDPEHEIRLQEHLQATLSALKSAFRRVEEVKTKRLNENKDGVSADNRPTLTSIAEEALSLHKQIESLLTTKKVTNWAEANRLRAESLRITNRLKEQNYV